MKRRQSKETVEFIIKSETSDDSDHQSNAAATAAAKKHNKKREKEKRKENKKLRKKAQSITVLPTQKKRRESTLHTIIEEEEVEELNNNYNTNNMCSECNNKIENRMMTKKNPRFHSRLWRWVFKKSRKPKTVCECDLLCDITTSTNCLEIEEGLSSAFISSSEIDINDTVDGIKSIGKIEDEQLLHGYRRRQRRNAVCDQCEPHWNAGWDFLLRSTNCLEVEEEDSPIIVCTEYDTVDAKTSVSLAEGNELLQEYRKRPRRNAVCETNGFERQGLKALLTCYAHNLLVDKYGLG